MTEEQEKLLRAVHAAVIRLETTSSTTRKAVTAMSRTIDGNGGRGLKTRVALLEAYAKGTWAVAFTVACLLINAIIGWIGG